MARCERSGCGRWRPSALVRLAGLGLYFDGAWYCSARCVEAAARARLARPSRSGPSTIRAMSPLRLGVLLTHQVGLSRETLAQALGEQLRTGLRLGAQLVAMGTVSEYEVLRALAGQAGVAFLSTVDRSRLLPAPGNLSRDAIRALGLVPFEVDGKNEVIRVACAAPLPRLALAAMRELTGQRIEPYLVSDAQFTQLLESYGAARPDPAPEPETLKDLPAAAARIVEAARAKGGVRMTEAHCSDHVWVRLESAGRTQDLWLQMGQGSGAQELRTEN